MLKNKNIRTYIVIFVIVAVAVVCILAVLGPAIGNAFHQITGS